MTDGWSIRLNVDARMTIETAAKRALPNETGGLLIGYYADSDILVERAVEVRDPTATRSSYSRHRDLAQKSLERALSDANEFLGYVGDWHSHPFAVEASGRDRATATTDANEKGMPLALVIALVDGQDVSVSELAVSPTETMADSAAVKQPTQPSSGEVGTATWRERQGRVAMRGWWKVRAVSIYLCVTGALLVLFAREAVARNGDATGATLALLGGGALVVAAFAPFIEGTLKLGTLEMNLRSRLIDGVTRASRDELDAVITLLEDEEIVVRKIAVPAQFVGLRLVDDSLRPMRQDYNITVIALLPQGETRWMAGGRISEEPLQGGMTMLIAGPPESIDAFLVS